jgi:molybdopterin synthase catalytic subunit
MSEPSLFVLTADPLDPSGLSAAVQAKADGAAGRDGHAGALTSFVGLVRSHNAGRVVLRLEYEAYQPLAVRAFERIAEEARRSWADATLGIHHRVGVLRPGDASVAIAAASPHRAEAFCACRFAIERVKQIAPIWKREFFEGGDVWIEGSTADPEDEHARLEARRRACG